MTPPQRVFAVVIGFALIKLDKFALDAIAWWQECGPSLAPSSNAILK